MSEAAPEPAAEAEAAPEVTEPAKAETDWQAEAKKWEKRAKDNSAKLKDAEPKLAEWQQLREASKTQEERAQEELTRLQTEAASWRSKAVLSRVEALAAAEFADPSDALSAVDPDDYLGPDGAIDEQALRADLAAMLERKPHWRRTGTTGPTPPPSFDGGTRQPATAGTSMNQLIRGATGRA